MKILLCLPVLCCAIAGLATGTARAGEKDVGIAAGWEPTNGAMLLTELNCAACHAPAAGAGQSRQAPILAEAGSRITPQFVRAFLSDPQKVKAGTPMPDLLHGLPAAERETTIDALVHFLAKQGTPPARDLSTKAQIARGQQLYHTVGCVACHAPSTAAPAQKKPNEAEPGEEQKPAPALSAVASVPSSDLAMKTTVDALAKFLADPLHIRPSGRMPSLHLSPVESREIAAYLLRDQYTPTVTVPTPNFEAAVYDGKWERVPDFAALLPKQVVTTDSVNLNFIPKPGKKQPTDFAVAFRGFLEVPAAASYKLFLEAAGGAVVRLDGKVVIDFDGLHKQGTKDITLELTAGRHPLEVGYTQNGTGMQLSLQWQAAGDKERHSISGKLVSHDRVAMIPKGHADFKADPAKAEQGKKLFASLGCASCHATSRPPTTTPLKAPELARLDPTAKGGCLDAAVAPGRPRYALSAVQRDALRKTVAKPAVAFDAKTAIDQAMNAWRCYACHGRDGKGGPGKTQADYFTYDILVDLGDEGRLPPSLTAVGAKLTSKGFQDALFSGKKYRSAMATRMPNFGAPNIGHLPALFDAADAPKVAMPAPTFSPQALADGRKLTGKTALACINCHAWGELRLPGAEGLDLLQVTRRIRPDWFHAWLQDPQKLRPGTRMPSSWPDGKSFFPTIQGGDTQRQIDAIWVYLAAGERAELPEGLSNTEAAFLVPTAEPIVYRTFLDKVSSHSILVGFPQRLHMAFDANRVRTAVVWAGDFVSTKRAWEGRGGEYAPIPSTSVAWLPEGPPFAKLTSQTDPWPKDVPRSPKIGSHRTPPGWRFQGYRYDDKRVPTFLYSIGVANVEETPGVEVRADGAFLQRSFQVKADADVPDLYMRVAAGKKITEADGVYTVDGQVRYRVTGAPLVRDVEGGQELIVPVRFAPAGAGVAASLKVEMAW